MMDFISLFELCFYRYQIVLFFLSFLNDVSTLHPRSSHDENMNYQINIYLFIYLTVQTTKRPMYLPRREMIGALITKKQSNQIILKNFQIEKIMKNLQINSNSPMAVTKGVLMTALLDVNFNLSSLPFQKEKKNVPFSYEETFYSICRHSYTVLSTFGMKTKRKKSKIRMRNRKYDIFPNSKKHDDGESCLFDEIDSKCVGENNEKYHTTVHTNCNDGDDHKIDDDSNSNSIENKEKNVIINKIKIEDKIKDHKIISKVKNETYVRAHQDMIGWFIPLEDKSTLLLSILQVDLGSDIPEWASEFGVALNIISSTSSFIKLVEGTKA